MFKFKPGVSFSDFVVTDFAKSRVGRVDKPPRDFRRGVVVWIGCLLGLIFLGVRLVTLQLLGYQRYKVLANENRLRLISLPAPRGIIYDRNGMVLAENQKIFKNEKGLSVPGFARVYTLAESTAHVIGYLGEVSDKELGLLVPGGEYQNGGLIGRYGLEDYYETKLRGRDGGWLIEVDSTGKLVRDLGKTLPQAGQALHTTLSGDLSKTAFEAMGGKKGAVVVSDPQTGEILALASSPSFDPNTLVNNFEKINSDPNLPLFNRFITGVYPPGSVFKMTVTIAAIDSGKVPSGFTVDDKGFIEINGYRYNNWLYTKHRGTEGVVSFAKAITRSTDTFFYQLGEKLGSQTMSDFSYKMGFGKKTGVDLRGEATGVVPDAKWKKEVKGENWYVGNSFHFAIGQDDLLVTPLQVNQMTNILATGGTNCVPHLVQGTVDSKQCTKINISNTALEIIKKGMIGACSVGGTAFPMFDWNEGAKANSGSSAFAKATANSSLPLVACKTGTAEYVAENGKMRTHGWLTAYAPVDNPKISVTVLMEGGGEGSNVAAPVVRKILAKYFNVTDKYPYANIPQEVGE